MSFYGKAFIGLPPKGIGHEPEWPKDNIVDHFLQALMVWGYTTAAALVLGGLI
jgi:hypothetical protein